MISRPQIGRGHPFSPRFWRDLQQRLDGVEAPPEHVSAGIWHSRPQGLRPFGVNTTDHTFRLTPANVLEIYPETAAVAGVHGIYAGGALLSSSPPPTIATAAFIYLKIETDDRGRIKDQGSGVMAQVVGFGSAQNTTHFVPPDGNGSAGTDGEYYLEIARFSGDSLISGSGWALGGSVIWARGGYVSFENRGVGAGVFKEYDLASDSQRLRGIEGKHAITDTEGTDDVELDFDGANIGGKEELYDTGKNRATADFATLGENNSGEIGINLTPNGAFATSDRWIEIHGTGFDKIPDSDGVVVACETKDGLIEAFTEVVGEDRDFKIIDIESQRVTVDGTTDIVQWVSEGSPTYHKWRSGIYQGTYAGGDAGVPVTTIYSHNVGS